MRLCDAREDLVLGAGILLSDRLALTCAHMLSGPEDELRVEFPETDSVPSTTARVKDGHWHPKTLGPNGRAPGGDVALLELDPPRRQAHRAPLRLASTYGGRKVRMCGYPQYQDPGSWVEHEIAGPYGPQWFVLKPPNIRESIRPGFSGAAVIDAAGLAGHHDSAPQSIVLGMVVSAFADGPELPPQKQQTPCYMIPTDGILGLIPQLRPYVAGVPPRDPSLSVRPRPGKGPAPAPDPRTARELNEWLGNEPARPRPEAMLVATDGDTRRDIAVRAALGAADLAVDAAGRNAPALIQELLERLGLPDVYQEELRGWLSGGQGVPPLLPDGASEVRPTIAVHGVDQATEPHALVEVLVRIRDSGCRVLAVCRYGSGSVWQQAARDLMVPALRRAAWRLVRDVADLERDARHRQRSQGGVPAGEVTPDRVSRLEHARNEPDPERQMEQLTDLLGRLDADAARLRPATAPEDAEDADDGEDGEDADERADGDRSGR